MRVLFNKYFKGDRIIWLVVLFLLLISLLAVYSSTQMLAYRHTDGNTTYFLLRHSRFLILGFIITYLVHRVPYQVFSKLAQWLLIISIPLLVVTMFKGVSINEASRWLSLPGGLRFQTSDLAKFALIMYVARLLAQNQASKEDLQAAFKPIITSVFVICALILPENFSTSALLFITCMVLMFIGRIDWKYILASVGVVVVVFMFFVSVVLMSDSKGRVGTWQNRIENYLEGDSQSNYQVEQAKIAIVTGGILGKGPGNSTQRNFLPQPYSDFIYAIIIEEYGIFGGLFTVFLYMYLLYRSVIIVKISSRTAPAFLAVGLALSLVFQAFINMAVAVNLIPVTGQPLPFVSMGGTSILFSSVALGIILSISRNLEENKKTEYQEIIIETAV